MAKAGSSSPITSNDSSSGDEESGIKELAISELVASLGTTSFPAMSVTVSEVRNKIANY